MGITFEDLQQEGWIGAIEAARRFNPGTGAPFGLFVERRISGRMLDYIRQQDPVGRYGRDRGRAGPVFVALNVAPVKVSRSQYRREMEVHEEVTAKRYDEQPSMEEALDDVRRLAVIRDAIRDMRPRQQQVYELYFVRDLSLAETGRRLGITESRVCQVAKAIEAELRERLGATPT